jgi:hypothetical protein
MTDKTIQRKLNQLRKIANELNEEAILRFEHGSLFYESGGTFYMMDGDSDSGTAERQAHIQFNSDGYCHMGCGSW